MEQKQLDDFTNYHYLRHFADSCKAEPKWFGLGFIQLKLNDTQRMHFWHPKLMSDMPDEEVHDHRYDFTSYILKGELTHEVWDFDADIDTTRSAYKGPYDLVLTNCKPGQPENPTVVATGDLHMDSSYTMKAGSHYSIQKDLLHRIKATNAVTFLERAEVEKDTARVVRNRLDPFVCPFSRTMDVNELWAYIEECLHGIPNGYHRTEIQKGTLGQSSKILEEVQELLDAELQENKVMALVELSDLVGAIQHYVETHYGEHLSLSDLEVMAKTTRRAFDHGRR